MALAPMSRRPPAQRLSGATSVLTHSAEGRSNSETRRDSSDFETILIYTGAKRVDAERRGHEDRRTLAGPRHPCLAADSEALAISSGGGLVTVRSGLASSGLGVGRGIGVYCTGLSPVGTHCDPGSARARGRAGSVLVEAILPRLSLKGGPFHPRRIVHSDYGFAVTWRRLLLQLQRRVSLPWRGRRKHAAGKEAGRQGQGNRKRVLTEWGGTKTMREGLETGNESTGVPSVWCEHARDTGTPGHVHVPGGRAGRGMGAEANRGTAQGRTPRTHGIWGGAGKGEGEEEGEGEGEQVAQGEGDGGRGREKRGRGR